MRDGLASFDWIGIRCLCFVGCKGGEELFLFSVLFRPEVLGPSCSVSTCYRGGAKVGFMILSHVNYCLANLFMIVNLINP